MRKSSRGNPNHDERGRFCSVGDCKIKSEKTPEEYEEQTKRRFASADKPTQLVTGIMWDVDEDYDGQPLPTEVEVPAGMNEDEISDYLSETYGFCHEGFSLETDKPHNHGQFNAVVHEGNQHFNLQGEPTNKYIRYGEPYDASKFEPVTNPEHAFLPKPNGGLWLSASNAKYSWADWCNDENMNLEGEPQTFCIKDAKILHLYKNEDLKGLPMKGNIPDFEALSKDYDAIEVHAGPITKLTVKKDFSVEEGVFYGWDCDSLVIFNKDILNLER